MSIYNDPLGAHLEAISSALPQKIGEAIHNLSMFHGFLIVQNQGWLNLWYHHPGRPVLVNTTRMHCLRQTKVRFLEAFNLPLKPRWHCEWFLATKSVF